MGIALLSAHTIAAELEDKRLTILPVEGMPIGRQWFVVKRREKRLPPVARGITWRRKAPSFLPNCRRRR